MTTAALQIEQLAKAYRLGLRDDAPDTLASALFGWVKSPLRNLRRLQRLDTFRHDHEADDLFWALRDVSLDVPEGEVLGVIGRNGAGKSTLLKILSRITEPTRGRVTVRGRVSSLLEVGTGFHPELSGRENVYLNGSILGMTKTEIDRKFDEIVAFSGVSQFLDTPIKRYSSGMKVRLAFAVAAHLEPEILIIDEVLAVGDAEFQKKCLGKMQEVAQGGRTVLFVSHNLSAVTQLCTRGVVLQQGQVACDAPVQDAVAAYTQTFREEQFVNADDAKPARIAAAWVRKAGDPAARGESIVLRTAPFAVQVRVHNAGEPFDAGLGISVEAPSLLRVLGNCTLFTGEPFPCRRGDNEFVFEIPQLPLNQGLFFVTLALHRWEGGETLDRHDQCLSFQVVEPPAEAGRIQRRPNDGVVVVDSSWRRADA